MTAIPQWMLAEFLPGNWAPDNPPEIVRNWARFRTRGGPTTSCYSLESRWRSKQPWDKPPITIVPIDMALAVVTEESWRDIPSHKHKFTLCWHWVYAWSKGKICRSLRQHGLEVALAEYPDVLTAAMASFHVMLDSQKKTVDDSREFGPVLPAARCARPLAGTGIPEEIAEAA